MRARSVEFAETSCLQRLRVERANGSEPQRTRSAAIAAIVIVDTFSSPGRPRASRRRARPRALPHPELIEQRAPLWVVLVVAHPFGDEDDRASVDERHRRCAIDQRPVDISPEHLGSHRVG